MEIIGLVVAGACTAGLIYSYFRSIRKEKPISHQTWNTLSQPETWNRLQPEGYSFDSEQMFKQKAEEIRPSPKFTPVPDLRVYPMEIMTTHMLPGYFSTTMPADNSTYTRPLTRHED